MHMMTLFFNTHIMAGNISWEHIGVVILLSALAVVAVNLPYWRKKTPKTTCRATIKAKRIGNSNAPHINYTGSHFDYMITFWTNEGKEVEVCVSEELYAMYKEGMTGTLTYQGESLLEFVEDCLR